jgi:hypothetical protein
MLQVVPTSLRGPVAQADAIAAITWYDVQVNVRHNLASNLSIGQPEVHSLAADIAAPQRHGQGLRYREQASASAGVQMHQPVSVFIGHHQRVSSVDGIDVHERATDIVTVDEAGRLFASQDSAEDALSHQSLP